MSTDFLVIPPIADREQLHREQSLQSPFISVLSFPPPHFLRPLFSAPSFSPPSPFLHPLLSSALSFPPPSPFLFLLLAKENGYQIEVVTFSYVNNQIIVKTEDEYDIHEVVFTLDNNGYVLRGTGVDKLGSVIGSETINYEYSNGYLVKESSGSMTVTYTWESGNLIKIVEDDGSFRCTRTLTYNNVENKLNIGKFGYGEYEKYSIGEAQPIGWFSCIYLDFIKFKGWTSKNFPISETWSYREGTGNTMPYTYTFDSDGYPIQGAIFVFTYY